MGHRPVGRVVDALGRARPVGHVGEADRHLAGDLVEVVPAAADQGLAVGHRPVGIEIVSLAVFLIPPIREYAIPIILVDITVNTVYVCF